MNKTTIIRGLSLTRPWPFAFVNGPEPEQKRVENRSWRPPAHLIGCYLALHAAKSWDEGGRYFISRALGVQVPGNAENPHSQIFAVCRLSDYVMTEDDARLSPEQRKWFLGPFVFLLTDFVKLVEPVPCIGAQGLWTFDQRQDELVQLRGIYRRSLVRQ